MAKYKPTLDEIKKLRSKTSCGIVACKEALENSSGDIEQAVLYLRKKGVARVAKRSTQSAKEGAIGVYVHGEHATFVALVELNCETDFVARTPEFLELAKTLAMQVAACGAEFVSRESVPNDI